MTRVRCRDGRGWRDSRSFPLGADRRRGAQTRARERSAGYASARSPRTIASAASAACSISSSTSARGSRNLPST